MPTVFHNVRLSKTKAHDTCSIGDFSRVYLSRLSKCVEIGRLNYVYDCRLRDYTYTGQNCHLIACEIGKFCSISWNVTIGAGEHQYQRTTQHRLLYNEQLLKRFKQPQKSYDAKSITTSLGHDVWVGCSAVIKQGVNIGTGSVIGAGSVVTKDVPAFAIVAGNPAEIIKFRFSESVCEEIGKLKWWDWSEKKIRDNWEILSMYRHDID